MMKILLIILGGIFVILYLNRAYAFIYWTLNDKHLPNPTTQGRQFISPSKLPPKKTIKYVAIGDSLSAGIGVQSPTQTLPYLIAQKIANQESYQVEMVNLGIPGARTFDAINYELDKTIREKPDYVTLLIGVNDVHGMVLPSSFKSNYKKIINRLKNETKAKIIVFNIPNIGIKNIVLPPYNILFLNLINNYNNFISDVSIQNNLELVDIYTPTETILKKDQNLYSIDHFHPSDKGYKIWADLVNVNTSK